MLACSIFHTQVTQPLDGPMPQLHRVGVLGTGVPGLACLRPAAWLSQQDVWPIFINKASKTLARGQDSRGGRRKTSSGAAPLGGLTRSRDINAGQTSRGSREVSHDNRHQAGASARSVLVSSLVLRRPAQARSTEASGKGCLIGATRPRPEGRQDGGHRGAQDASPPERFAGEDHFCQDSLY